MNKLRWAKVQVWRRRQNRTFQRPLNTAVDKEIIPYQQNEISRYISWSKIDCELIELRYYTFSSWAEANVLDKKEHLYSIISFQTLQTTEIKLWKLKQPIWKLSSHDQYKVTKVLWGEISNSKESLLIMILSSHPTKDTLDILLYI